MPCLVHSKQHGLLLPCRDKDPLTSFDWWSDQNGVSVHNTDMVTGSRVYSDGSWRDQDMWWGADRRSQLLTVKSLRLKAGLDDDMHPLGFSHALSFLFCSCLYELKLEWFSQFAHLGIRVIKILQSLGKLFRLSICPGLEHSISDFR